MPIAFVGSGERLEDLEPFHPERVVSRVLGMGDVLSLIEKAEAAIDEDQAERLEEKIRSNEFTLEDFRDQLKMIRKMGPIESIIGMLPGMGNVKALAENKPDENQIARIDAIISSMTPDERRKQHIINGSRRKRIAKGSGTSVEEVNRLLKQFVQMQKMLKSLGGMTGLAGGGKKARRRAMQMMSARRHSAVSTSPGSSARRRWSSRSCPRRRPARSRSSSCATRNGPVATGGSTELCGAEPHER